MNSVKRFANAAFAAIERKANAAGAPTHLFGPSLFRVLAGITILSEYLLVYGQRHLLFGNQGIIPYTTYTRWDTQFSIYRFTSTNFTFELAYHVSIVVTALWTLGILTRWLTPCLVLCWSSLMDRGPGIWDGGDNLIAILLIYACFVDLGTHLSPSNTNGKSVAERHPALGIIHSTAMSAWGLQVCVVYFVAGLMKARGHTWLDGSALYNAMADRQFAWPGVVEWLYGNALVLSVAGPLTILFQLSLPFFFYLNPKSRIVILVVAMSFHLAIGIFMGLLSFASFFIAAELALISDAEYGSLAEYCRKLYRTVRSSLRPHHVLSDSSSN